MWRMGGGGQLRPGYEPSFIIMDKLRDSCITKGYSVVYVKLDIMICYIELLLEWLNIKLNINYNISIKSCSKVPTSSSFRHSRCIPESQHVVKLKKKKTEQLEKQYYNRDRPVTTQGVMTIRHSIYIQLLFYDIPQLQFIPSEAYPLILFNKLFKLSKNNCSTLHPVL